VTNATILLWLLIVALVSGAALAGLSPIVGAMRLSADVVALQAMVRAYGREHCADMPIRISTMALAEALGLKEPTGRPGTAVFSSSGTGQVDVVYPSSSRAWQAARAGRGSVVGTTAQLPIRATALGHAVGVHELRNRSIGGESCF